MICIEAPITESEIQAISFVNLKSKYKWVRLELTYKKKARFDIIIFDKFKKPALIIEVKKPSVKTNIKSEQVLYYSQLMNIPIIMINQVWHAENIIEFVENYIKHNSLQIQF